MFTTITFSIGTLSVSAELYSPPAGPPKGAVVIAYGSDGLVNNANGQWATMIRGYAEDLAKEGMTVLIPDYLATTATPPGVTAIEALQTEGGAWESVIESTISHAATLAPGVQAGLLGFSLGGYLCLRVRGQAAALSSYFAPFDPVAPSGTGIGATPVGSRLTHAELHHGVADVIVPITNATQIEAALTGEGVATQLFTYPGAGHGFVGTDPDDTNARKESKTRTLAFFATHL